MSNLKIPLSSFHSAGPFIRGASAKYITYICIAILAYFAGDQKLLNQVYEKIVQLPRQDSANLVTPSKEGEYQTRNQSEQIYLVGKFKVIYVVDGDTVHVNGMDENNQNIKNEIVRLMAVNTLEKNSNIQQEKCWAFKQTEFTRQNLLSKEIYLYGDKTQPERDKYNRLLAYIATSTENFLNANQNYFYNDYLMQTGNAKTYRATPPAYKFKIFESEMEIAKKNKLGMWSDALCK